MNPDASVVYLSLEGGHPLGTAVAAPGSDCLSDFPFSGYIQGTLLVWSAWPRRGGCLIKAYFAAKGFLTQISKGASMSQGQRAPMLYKIVCNYLYQPSIKKGYFYPSKAEVWQSPSCEILLTKVLSEGQGDVAG